MFLKYKLNIAKPIIQIAIMFIVSRVMLYFIVYLGDNLFASYVQLPIYQTLTPDRVVLDLPGSLLATHLPTYEDFTKFDAQWYLKIAKSGYDNFPITGEHSPANWVFFPLFPLLIRGIHLITGVDYALSGVLLSNITFLASLITIYYIAKDKFMSSTKVRMLIAFILIYPSSLYYSVPYTESLFLLFCALTIYMTDRRRYKLALIIAGLSSITRIPGFINVLYVLVHIILDKGIRFRKKDIYLLAYLAFALLPLTLFFSYMYYLTGDFLAPLHEQSISWYRATTFPFMNYVRYILHPYFIAPGGWDNGLISFIVATSVLGIFLLYLISHLARLRNPKDLIFFLYGFALIAIPFSSSERDLTSVIRYMMVSLPFYFYLVEIASHRYSLRIVYLFLFITLNILTIIAYANSYHFVV